MFGITYVLLGAREVGSPVNPRSPGRTGQPTLYPVKTADYSLQSAAVFLRVWLETKTNIGKNLKAG